MQTSTNNILGIRDAAKGFAISVRFDGDVQPAQQRREIAGRVSTGFEWGYGGTGPNFLGTYIVNRYLTAEVMAMVTIETVEAFTRVSSFTKYQIAEGEVTEADALREIIVYNLGPKFTEWNLADADRDQLELNIDVTAWIIRQLKLLEVGDVVTIARNQGDREATVLEVVGAEALIVYEMEKSGAIYHNVVPACERLLETRTKVGADDNQRRYGDFNGGYGRNIDVNVGPYKAISPARIISSKKWSVAPAEFV